MDNLSRPYINHEDLNIFVKIVKSTIKSEFALITTLVSYLRNIADICNKLDIPILWQLPNNYKQKLFRKKVSIN